MELKEKLISSFVAFEEEMDLNTKVHKIRSKNFDHFEKTGFPSKKDEEWKYTSLDNLLKKNYRIDLFKQKYVFFLLIFLQTVL